MYGIITSRVTLVRSDYVRLCLTFRISESRENIVITQVALRCDQKDAVFPQAKIGLCYCDYDIITSK